MLLQWQCLWQHAPEHLQQTRLLLSHRHRHRAGNNRNRSICRNADARRNSKSTEICFLFIGDGMSYPQFQAASDYLGAIADEDYVKALPSNSYEDRGGAVLDGSEAGYKVTYTQADAEAVTAEDGRVILMDEHLADSDAMDYDMDRADGEWALSDYVQKGIEVLDNDTGFFMMCEGGKIDWACHANDAGAKDKTEDLHKMIKEYKFDEQE